MAKKYPSKSCYNCIFRTMLLDYTDYPRGRVERNCCVYLMQENKPGFVTAISSLSGKCEHFLPKKKTKLCKFDQL